MARLGRFITRLGLFLMQSLQFCCLCGTEFFKPGQFTPQTVDLTILLETHFTVEMIQPVYGVASPCHGDIVPLLAELDSGTPILCRVSGTVGKVTEALYQDIQFRRLRRNPLRNDSMGLPVFLLTGLLRRQAPRHGCPQCVEVF